MKNGRPYTARPEAFDNRPENDGPFTLSRDGKDIMHGTWAECAGWIHARHCYSLSHAVAHEGYKIERATA